ncbi:hypothetical protein ACS0TY_027087 [Phlomoides rotata]
MERDLTQMLIVVIAERVRTRAKGRWTTGMFGEKVLKEKGLNKLLGSQPRGSQASMMGSVNKLERGRTWSGG